MQSLARQKEWDSLEKYLAEVQEGIPFSFELDLPRELPVPEIDLCSVLSNLLENALETSLRTAPARRRIKAQAHLHSGHMILLTVENNFDGEIREKNGRFQASKRKGEGIGIQSVRRIADKNGGYSRFSYENGIFCADVMLRGGK